MTAYLVFVRAEVFDRGLTKLIDQTFTRHRELEDHRDRFPWLRGWLGDQAADAWFISEAPSAWRVEREGPKEPRTFEDQWAISPGDREFRLALSGAGFKDGDPLAAGGWRCYVTVLSKSMVDFGVWRHRPLDEKMLLFRKWAQVLQCEVSNGTPRLLVAMGADTAKALRRLVEEGLVSAPPVAQVWSYGYLMRASTEREKQLELYRTQFREVRRMLDGGRAKPN